MLWECLRVHIATEGTDCTSDKSCTTLTHSQFTTGVVAGEFTASTNSGRVGIALGQSRQLQRAKVESQRISRLTGGEVKSINSSNIQSVVKNWVS